MIMPSVAHLAKQMKDEEEEDLAISHGAAIILFGMYILYLVFQLKTHPEYFETAGKAGDDEPEEQPVLGTLFACFMLAIITGLVSWCSDGLVESVEGMTKGSGISPNFIGVVLLPIIG